MRQFANSVNYVGNFSYVFNIRGNRYWLATAIVFTIRTVFVKFIGTHQTYDKIDVTTVDYTKP